MSIKISSGAIKLAFWNNLLQVLYLVLKTVCIVGNLLTHGGWGSALSVGTAEHWDFRKLICDSSQLALEILQRRQNDILEGVMEHQSIGEIVDIFRSTRKMKIFLLQGKVSISVKSFFEEVFDGFDIMIGGTLNLLDSFSVLNRERGKHIVHEFLLSCNFLDSVSIICDNLLVEQGLEPIELDKNAEPH